MNRIIIFIKELLLALWCVNFHTKMSLGEFEDMMKGRKNEK